MTEIVIRKNGKEAKITIHAGDDFFEHYSDPNELWEAVIIEIRKILLK